MNIVLVFQEFWFTAGATFFYFTAFVSILTGFVGYEDKEWQYWIDANIAAGVSLVLTSREREILGNLAGDCTNIPIRRSSELLAFSRDESNTCTRLPCCLVSCQQFSVYIRFILIIRLSSEQCFKLWDKPTFCPSIEVIKNSAKCRQFVYM